MKKLPVFQAAALAAAFSSQAFALDASLTVMSKTYDLEAVPATLISPSTPVGAAPGEVTAAGGKLRVAMPLPAFGVGKNPALVVNAFYLDGDEQETRAVPSSMGFVPVDGSGPSNGTGGVTTLTFATEIAHYGVDALLQTSLVEEAPQRLSVYGGLTYSHLEQEHRFGGLDPAGTSVDAFLSLKDEIETDYIGVAAGADYAFQLMPGLELLAGLRVDLLDAQSDLDVRQVINGVPYAVTADDSGFIPRYEAKLGLGYRFSNVTASLVASVESLNLPAVEHAVYDSNIFPSRITENNITNTAITVGFGVVF